MSHINEAPSVFQTPNGLSVLFRNIPLYSKYNPQKAVLQAVQQAVFKPRSLVVLLSPVLDYGIAEILSRLDEKSFLLAIQPNSILYNFSTKHLQAKNFSGLKSKQRNFKFVCINETEKFFLTFFKLDKAYNFDKTIFIASSALALTDLHQKTFFKTIKNFTDSYFKKKIVNRLTLIQIGHGYAINFFKNLKYISQGQKTFFSVESVKTSKPILILGGGPSLDAVIKKLLPQRNLFFIIALDAVAAAISNLLIPDAIIVLESQIFIAEAFSDFFTILKKNKMPMLFLDLTTNPSIIKNWKGDFYFYFTEYTEAKFLENLKKHIEFLPIFESVGSVGLSAIQVALQIRVNTEVPIFTAGLDFAYTLPFTHSKYAFQVQDNYASTNKLNPLLRGEAFFSSSVLKLKSTKKHLKVFSTQALLSYAKIFNNFCKNEKKLYAISSFITKNGLLWEQVLEFTKNINKKILPTISLKTKTPKCKASIQEFLEKIEIELNALKDCLTGKTPLDENELQMLILKNDFLFLHFPDYSKDLVESTLTQSFLNRIRAEVEYFLKFLQT